MQRLTELHRKREILGSENKWFQTLKPRNKVLEVSLKKVILNKDPLPLMRAGG